MLSFLKKIFGAAEPDVTPVPYKVETPIVTSVKKETVPKATTSKPRKPKAPKA